MLQWPDRLRFGGLILCAVIVTALAKDAPAQINNQRLAVLQAIHNQRMVLLQRRENLSQQVVPIRNQIKLLNGQAGGLFLQSNAIGNKLAQLQQANNQLEQQRPLALSAVQAANIDATIQQNIADGRALEIQQDAVLSQMAGIQSSVSGLNSQLRDAEVAAMKLYAEADQLRIEWLNLMDPFGKFARAEHEAAILTFTEWVVLDGENSGAFLARGFAYRRLGQLEKALADFSRAVELGGPISIPALAARGGVLHAMGKRREGLADLGKAMKRDKSDAVSYLIRANVRLAEGNYRMALSDLKVAANMNQRDPEARQQMAIVLASCPIKSLRNGKKAVENAKLACELTKWKDWTCLDSLAAAHAELGEYKDAAKWEDKAAELANAENRERCLERLKLYEDGKPLRLDWAAEA